MRAELDTTLNGRPVTSLTVPVGRHLCRIGPLTLTSGDNTLVLRRRETLPSKTHIAGDVRARVLSLAVRRLALDAPGRGGARTSGR